MAERRYSDEEVAAIFQAAAELQQRAALDSSASGAAMVPSGASNEGMTLDQLREIGREVGIPGDLVAQAAGSLDKRGRASVRRFLGLPIGVGRTVALERRLSDAEWERLVVDLRTTFDARGRLTDEGSFRQWTNGNLQALLEPTPTGHQLRLRTMKGDAYAAMTAGLGMFAVSALMLVANALRAPIDNFAPAFMVAAMGAAMFAFGALRIPGWARTRTKQMEEIAERVTQALPAPNT
jgi:hypothetical protein